MDRIIYKVVTALDSAVFATYDRTDAATRIEPNDGQRIVKEIVDIADRKQSAIGKLDAVDLLVLGLNDAKTYR